MARKQTPDFEQSLSELQTLVERLESGTLSLEESLGAFEQGIRLTRDCQAALSQAEQKVQLLLGEGENLRRVPFSSEEPSA
ncbi:exodeoxyribonuclease VII small subunit [Pseudomonas sp. NW5]|uniref:exodeoxyribonuclease VII small subunit n=1 Tax=Pseudomonas sp. NW5 TaxID=2934934 RepID=UPI0020210584|nr:exodeoxyribonuclease VII small subunit [Pseudomonas sp. NW5]MCL7462812.1 exodeoxyribonuclease VII small subunit [Pseudomonas sp. NW5]